MFTDKHFPPTFLSKNPSLRDMVKDQTDYDRRISDITTKFQTETKNSRGKPASTSHRSTIQSHVPETGYSSSSYISSASYTRQETRPNNSHALPLYPTDLRIGEERAVRASQRRMMRSTPTKQMDNVVFGRCITPNIFLNTPSSDHNLVGEQDPNSHLTFPQLSYGRITPSRNLFPTRGDSSDFTNMVLHRPSEYYR